jgi:hypothetical protein
MSNPPSNPPRNPSDLTSPSEPARGPHDEPKVVAATPPFFRRAGIALFLSLLPWLLVGSLWATKPRNNELPEWFAMGLIVALLASPFIALFVAITSVRALRRFDEDERPPGLRVAQVARGIALGTIVAGFLYTLFGMAVMRGRQLRRRGRARLAALIGGASWSTHASVHESVDAPREVADAWRHNALTEHASVAAFSHVALDLIAVGAPASLVRACHEAALDEVRHTELCFAVATSIDGATRTPAPFADASERPLGPVTLERVAREALIEGALLEGAAAHVATMLAARVEDEAIRRALAHIARDERVHAEHGWRVLEWCLERDASLFAVVEDALAAAPHDVAAGPLADGSGERFGIASHETLRAAYACALDDAHTRLATLTTRQQRNAA